MLGCMRITLSLDEDVAALLRQLRQARKSGLKELVTFAFREGLQKMRKPDLPRKPYRTKPVSLGRCYSPNLDKTHEILDEVEGPWHK